MSWLDGGLAVALIAFALLVRLPYLMQIPRLGDEVFEALQAFGIARGEATPLVGVNPLYGPLFAYLLALCFRLFGAAPQVPRALAAAAASLTVALTYLLARHRLRSRPAAALAAGLLATTPVHVLVSSHLGYSNSTTPLFTTAMLLALVVAVDRAGEYARGGPLLVLGGFLAGLSLQTHLSVLPLLAGLSLWFLAQRGLAQRRGRAWLRTPWPYLALAAALAAYSPVIVFNLGSGFATLAEPVAHPYAYTGQMTPARYLNNLRLLVQELGWMVDGRMSVPSEPLVFVVLGALRVGWLVLGLLYALRRRDGLLGALLLATAATLPAFNNLYSRTMGTRYVMWLLPLVYAAMAAPVVDLLRRLRGGPGRALAAACVVALLLYPLAPLGTYYASHQARQRTNQDLLRFARTIGAPSDGLLASLGMTDGVHPPRAASLVVVSEGTDLLYLSNAGTVLSAMDYLLTLQDIPHVTVAGDRLAEAVAQPDAGPVWLVAGWEEGQALAGACSLQVVDSGIVGGEPEHRLGLFVRMYAIRRP